MPKVGTGVVRVTAYAPHCKVCDWWGEYSANDLDPSDELEDHLVSAAHRRAAKRKGT